MEQMESGLVLRQNIMIRYTGIEFVLDNSFKHFGNCRDNRYYTIIVYVTSFATYLNRGVNLADFQSSGNIPLAKELLNEVEII